MASRSLGTLTLDLIAKVGGFTEGMDKAERAAAKAARRVSQEMRDAASETDSSLKAIISGAQKAAGVLAAGFSVHQMLAYADEWSEIKSRVENAVGAGEQAERVLRSISATARNTYSPLKQTAEAFLNNAGALTELGYSTEQQIALSDALNNALVISATRGQQAESVMAALSKAFAAGELRGDNWNTVLQNGGRIVQALADGLGVTTLELRRMAGEGLLTTEKVVGALTSQVAKLRDEAGAMAATVGDATALLGNSMLELVGHIDQSTGASESLANAIIAIADAIRPLDEDGNLKGWAQNLDLVADAAAVAAIAVGGRLAAAAGASALSWAAATAESIRYQMALARMTGVSRATAAALTAQAAAARAASGAMALLGGPAGVALLAAGSLIYFANSASTAEAKSRELDDRIAKLGGSFEKLDNAQRARALQDYNDKLVGLRAQMKDAQARADLMKRSIDAWPDDLESVKKWQRRLVEYSATVSDLKSQIAEVEAAIEQLSKPRDAAGGVAAESEEYRKLKAQIEERIALIGKTGEAAKLRYQIETNALQKISKQEALALLPLYERFDALREAQQTQEKARQEEEARKKSIADEIAALELQARQIAMTREERILDMLAMKGATDEQKKAAVAALETISAYEKRAELQRQALAVIEDLKTGEEKFAEQLALLDEMLEAGMLTWDQYAAAVANAQNRLENVGRAAKDALTEVDRFAKTAAENTQGLFADILFDGMQGEMDDVAAMFKRMIDRMVAEAASAQLARKMFGTTEEGGLSGTGGWAGAVGTFIAGLFGGGRASGGPVAANGLYEVNERGPELLTVGGRDFLMMGKTPGMVTPNHKLGGVTNNITIHVRPTGNETADRRAAQQVALEVQRALARAARRNG